MSSGDFGTSWVEWWWLGMSGLHQQTKLKVIFSCDLLVKEWITHFKNHADHDFLLKLVFLSLFVCRMAMKFSSIISFFMLDDFGYILLYFAQQKADAIWFH